MQPRCGIATALLPSLTRNELRRSVCYTQLTKNIRLGDCGQCPYFGAAMAANSCSCPGYRLMGGCQPKQHVAAARDACLLRGVDAAMLQLLSSSCVASENVANSASCSWKCVFEVRVFLEDSLSARGQSSCPWLCDPGFAAAHLTSGSRQNTLIANSGQILQPTLPRKEHGCKSA